MKRNTHRWLSILEGCILVALGIHILNSAGLLMTGTAGASLILMRLTDFSFGEVFFVLNIPFYCLAWFTLGREFTIRTFISVSLLSLISEWMSLYATLTIHPLLAATLGGLLVGFGVIILFRHNSSLGGLNILAVFLERKFSFHASKTTLIADISIFIAGLIVLDLSQLGYSLIAFVLLSSVVGRYHRPPEWAKVPDPDTQ